jgi:peptidoglycan/xylan/chitin deacetylase (PgdA/CDA1 family)
MTAAPAQRVRRLLIVLHVIALLAGAAAAHFTAPPDPIAQAARPRATKPEAIAALTIATPDRQERVPAAAIDPTPASPPEVALAVTPEQAAEPVDPAAPEPTPGDDPLGARYRDGLIINGSTRHRLILFTFDDGPDPRTTPLLLDRLDEAGVKAVFFLVASRIAGTTPIERHQAAIAQEIARRGHLIGGHTLDHVQLPLLSDEEVERQLAEPERIFQRVLGSRTWLFRPPFGAHSQRVDQHLAAHRYTPVLWNLGAGDFQVRATDDVVDIWLKVLERRQRENGDRGGIILLHDTHEWSVNAFERIFAYLQTQNCSLLEHGEELYDIVDDLSFFYVPRADAPAETEADPAEPPADVLAARQAALRERTARRCKSLASASF